MPDVADGEPVGGLPRRDALKMIAMATGMLTAGAITMVLGDAAKAAADISGMSVFLDPGHSGVNDDSLSQQVPNGRGGTKDCQTTGTATGDGYPEHSFNFDVVQQINAQLLALGVRTNLSRNTDDAVGPCVNTRAEMANDFHPDAVISVHADGAAPSGHGFHVNYSDPPLNNAQSGPAMTLATMMRDSLIAAGLQPSNYRGTDGLFGRDDLAGLNFAQYPSILIECGNMKNREEAASMESPAGQARYTTAITKGIVAYLTATRG